MKAHALERIFLAVLTTAATPAVVGCGPRCPDVAPAPRVTVPLSTIPRDFSDGGGGADVTPRVDEGLPGSFCTPVCGFPSVCEIETIDGDTATLVCIAEDAGPGCGTGRRPEGLDPATSPGMFAEMARLEAASVEAFRRLRAELASHGAPRRLLRACSRAMRDEVRHARIMGALALRRGERVELPSIAPARARSLEAMAVENVVEGCVRETWGALVATRDARTHSNPAVRAAMKRIAPDETRHAALAWSISSWLEPRLTRSASERVRQARLEEARRIATSTHDEAATLLASTLWGVASERSGQRRAKKDSQDHSV
jgi:hypothetical protein